MSEKQSNLPDNYNDFIKSDLFMDGVKNFLKILVRKNVIKNEDKEKIFGYFSTLKDDGELDKNEISNFVDLLNKNEIEELWNRFSEVSKKKGKIRIGESIQFADILKEIFGKNGFSQIKKYIAKRVFDILDQDGVFEMISQYIESGEVEFLFEGYGNLIPEQINKFSNLKAGRGVYNKGKIIYKNWQYDINSINDVIPYGFFKKFFLKNKNRFTEYKNFSDIPFYTQTFYQDELDNYFVLLSTQKIQGDRVKGL